MRRAGTLFLAVLFVFAQPVFTERAQAAEAKLGYVDIAKVFDTYDKTKDEDGVLTAKSEKEQAKREKTVEKIRNMKNELELLSDKQKQKKQEEIDAEIRGLQDFDRETKAELRRERDDMLRNILKEIDLTIEEYAKKNGYSIIFNSRILVYGEEQYDVTREIINILNSKYRKNK